MLTYQIYISATKGDIGAIPPSGGSPPSPDTVILRVSPVISESRAAEYHDDAMPGVAGVVVYTMTQNRRFTIGAQLVSRTIPEADENYGYVNLLRSWMIPNGSNDSTQGTPPILRLSGYQKQFNDIPVVLSEMSVNYSDDVDYIEATDAMVPIIQKVDITLIEAHNISYTSITAEFDLTKFKQGLLTGY